MHTSILPCVSLSRYVCVCVCVLIKYQFISYALSGALEIFFFLDRLKYTKYNLAISFAL